MIYLSIYLQTNLQHHKRHQELLSGTDGIDLQGDSTVYYNGSLLFRKFTFVGISGIFHIIVCPLAKGEVCFLIEEQTNPSWNPHCHVTEDLQDIWVIDSPLQ